MCDMLKFSRCGNSHLVFPFCSIMPGVSNQPPCLGRLEQLSWFDWNEETVPQSRQLYNFACFTTISLHHGPQPE